jgi:multiple sugar transport system ATP-binding protein
VEDDLNMASVQFQHASMVYPGSSTPAVDNLDLEIQDGEFMVLVGPSGCGKSTSLRMLAGLEEVTEGSISIGDRDVTRVPPKNRDIAMVFQNYALYPHMSVADNMAFALKMQRVARSERDKRVREAAELLGISELLGRRPKALSGGQRQRVAMGRAIVRQPQVFCMDEPLSNLDAKLRVTTRTQIVSLQSRLAVTTVYVTHDQVEAMTMGDRVAVLDNGVLQQVDKPMSLYRKPRNLFVAGFIGSPAMNLLPAQITDHSIRIGSGLIPLAAQTRAKIRGDVTIGIRPESWRIVGPEDAGLPVTVVLVEELGSDAFLHGSVQDDDRFAQIVVRLERRHDFAKGSTVVLMPAPDQVHVFDNESGERLTE